MAFCWQQAQHQVTRELGWCIFSPSIAEYSLPPTDISAASVHPAPWHIPEDEESQYILKSVDKQPAELEKFLNRLQDRRLGARFEAFWHFFLAKHSFYQVLATNLQITSDSRTLGSIDILIDDGHLNDIVHLELAVKFYLHMPQIASPENSALAAWIGPNPDDNLDLKIRHFANHQLPLTTQKEALASIKALGLPTPNLRTAIMKGYLFYPRGERPPMPEALNPQHQKGIWIYAHELERLNKNYPNTPWHILGKDQWLDPSPVIPAYRRTSAAVIKNQLNAQQQPLMVQGLAIEAGGSDMVKRFFIVPEGWPDDTPWQRGENR